MSKKRFARLFKEDIHDLAKVKLDPTYVVTYNEEDEKYYDVDGNEIDIKKLMFMGDKIYKMDKDLPNDYQEETETNPGTEKKIYSVVGFLESARKENRKSKLKKKDDRLMASVAGKYPVSREKLKMTNIAGYIRVANSDSFVAVMKPKPIIPFILLCGLLALLLLLIIPEEIGPTFVTDFRDGITNRGEIVDEYTEHDADIVYFNLHLNVTPTVNVYQTLDAEGNTVDVGTMNIRIQNPEQVTNPVTKELQDSNPCVVVVTLLGEKDSEGNLIKEYDEPVVIWESPLVEGGTYIEEATLDVVPEAGRYLGRATYMVYQWNEGAQGYYLVGNTAAKLDVVVK